jgi:hypothetical protein
MVVADEPLAFEQQGCAAKGDQKVKRRSQLLSKAKPRDSHSTRVDSI